MSSDDGAGAGHVPWRDLTVPAAEQVRDFYREVVGWEVEPVDMGGYDDFAMVPPGSDEPVAGICHARGSNADLPAQWLVYITVEDLEASVARCRKLGGEVVAGPRGMGGGRICVVRDPSGAAAALYEPA